MHLSPNLHVYYVHLSPSIVYINHHHHNHHYKTSSSKNLLPHWDEPFHCKSQHSEERPCVGILNCWWWCRVSFVFYNGDNDDLFSMMVTMVIGAGCLLFSTMVTMVICFLWWWQWSLCFLWWWQWWFWVKSPARQTCASGRSKGTKNGATWLKVVSIKKEGGSFSTKTDFHVWLESPHFQRLETNP